MTTPIGITGLAPKVLITPTNPERAKYQEMWKRSEYREVAPGEHAVMAFLSQARMAVDSEVLDFGCGTGRGALMIALLGQAKVHLLDFADNCLDDDVRQALETQKGRVKFSVVDLTRPIQQTAAYGYCTDVLEHIPPQDVVAVLRNVLGAAQHVFFQISCVDDKMGALIGEPLHLTVRPGSWWLKQLTDLGAVIHWHQSNDEAVMVYCSSWKDAEHVVTFGRVNVDEAVVSAQVRENIDAGWQHATPWNTQPRELILLAGGPSMAAMTREIVELRAAGAALVTVNGAYDWAIQNGMDPSLQIVLDARAFNARFTRTPHATCKYMIASQCHPDTLAGLPRDRTWLWHSGISEDNEARVREITGNFFPVPGGSTVVLRAIPLLRMLGFTQIHVFGFDSCVLPAEDGAAPIHHAYAQAENDGEVTLPVNCGGRVFQCAPWMVSQSAEFRDLIAFMGDMVELDIRGDGLIAHIVKTGYEMAVAADFA